MGDIQPLIPLVVVETTMADGIAFHADWLVTKVLLILYLDCGVSFSNMVSVE